MRAPTDLILIVAPIGADATNIHAVLERAGHAPKICRAAEELTQKFVVEIGVIVLTEEAVTSDLLAVLGRLFTAQPAWSDIPIVLIGGPHPHSLVASLVAKLRGPRRTVTVVERPMSSATLLGTLDTLLAARHRQFEIRDLLSERDALLNSLETRVAERTGQLQRMVEEMEAFSYTVSHDLRAPLRSIAGYAEVLQEDHRHELSPDARAYCEKIARAARRLDTLTQEILAYTRVARGEMQIVSVDLDSLVSEVIEQYPALVASAASFRVARPLGCVRGHAPSLIQCFSNLFGNAVKFVPAGRAPVVEVRATLSAGRRRVFVKDNGVGIAPASQRRIFRMFERAAGKDIPGTGIGLAIVRKAVERMGGNVGVHSNPGEGAEFWIELDDAPAPCAVTTKSPDLATFWFLDCAGRPAGSASS